MKTTHVETAVLADLRFFLFHKAFCAAWRMVPGHHWVDGDEATCDCGLALAITRVAERVPEDQA